MTTMDHTAHATGLSTRHRDTPAPAFVSALRREGAEAFSRAGFPSKGDEAWKYTNVSRLASTPYDSAAVNAASLVDRALVDALALTNDGARVVVVNGKLVPALSDLDTMPTGVSVRSMSAALAQDAATLEGMLGSTVRPETHPFAALNTARLSDGVLIETDPGAGVDRPIEIIDVTIADGSPVASHPRVLVRAARGSSLRVVETFAVAGDAAALTNAVTELIADDGATIEHVRAVRSGDSGDHVGLLGARLGRDAHVHSCVAPISGRITRTDYECDLAGENGEALFSGINVLDGRRHADHHLRVEHNAPHCRSREYFKNVLAGESRAAFTGRIYVRQGAQKTDGIQTNATLLLSDSARVDTRPQLEIFADDVRCTHGATVGQLDESSLFYLRSRGLPMDEARALLVRAFAAEITDKIRMEDVRDSLLGLLFEHFSGVGGV